jgi:hypothetical protein
VTDIMTIDGYSFFARNFDHLNLPGVQDRRLEDLHSALTLIVKSNSLDDSKILAYQVLEHIKGMSSKCHPGHPEWGHPHPEYLELPAQGNPFVKST